MPIADRIDYSAIAVQSDIPLPAPRKRRAAMRDKLAELDIHGSFFLPCSISGAYGRMQRYLAELGIKVTCRTVDEDGVTGCRIWRIE